MYEINKNKLAIGYKGNQKEMREKNRKESYLIS